MTVEGKGFGIIRKKVGRVHTVKLESGEEIQTDRALVHARKELQ